MDIIVQRNSTPLDRRGRNLFRKVKGAPSFYRARNWPYKGRRTLVKRYGVASLSASS